MRWVTWTGRSRVSLLNLHTWSLCCKATERSSFQRVWWGCFVYGFGVGPFSNHHHSSLAMSKTWGPCGKLQRWVIALRDAFSCSTETWCTYKRNTLSISLWFPMCLQLPWESVILSKLSLAPKWFRGKSMVCFSYISDLLCLSRGESEFCGSSALSEWITLKAVWKGLGDLMARLGLWLGNKRGSAALLACFWQTMWTK